MKPAALRRLLLRMIAAREMAAGDCSGLTGADWALIDGMADQHRLRPMLHHRHGANEAIPADLRAIWREAYRFGAITALVQQTDLAQAVQRLEEEGMAPIALKGAWLVRYAYPVAALRPMRDVDLLLTPETVMPAYEALLAMGYSLFRPAEMSLEDCLRLDKHLPALVSPRGTLVELHHRLWELDGRLDHAMPAGREAEARAGATRRDGLLWLAPQDTLAHLVVHAVHSHRLDCGPLVLSDIANLIVSQPDLDWDAFWGRARREGWRGAARLLLDLVAQHDPAIAIGLPEAAGAPTPPGILDDAVDLLLQDLDTRKSAGAVAALLSWTPARIWRRLRGARQGGGEANAVREMAGEGGYSGWLRSRLLRTFADIRQPGVFLQSRQLARFSDWIDS